MRTLRWIPVLAWLGCFPVSANAVGLTKLDRTIGQEPAYQSKNPRYCLLVFGHEAKTRVWLVLDGDTLFVDANGNGDLTEPGERTKVKTRDRDPASFEEVELLGSDGKTKHKLQFTGWGWFDFKQGKTDRLEPSVTVSWKGRTYGAWGDEESPLVFAPRPQDAPILHIDGPLQMGFEVREEHALVKKGKDTYELFVGVGTKGVGKGSFVHLKYWDNAIPESAQPTAELEFPNKEANGPPVRVKTVLTHRC